MGIPTLNNVIHPNTPRRKLAAAGLALAAASAVTGAVVSTASPAAAPGQRAASLVGERTASTAHDSRFDPRQPLAGGYPSVAAPTASATPTASASPTTAPSAADVAPSPTPASPRRTRSGNPSPSRGGSGGSGSGGSGTVVASGACVASYYDEGQRTASGEHFNPNALTAAHRSLPMGSRVRVVNSHTGAAVVVRINDRGPYVSGRCLDLSRAAFASIANLGAGAVSVEYQVLSRG